MDKTPEDYTQKSKTIFNLLNQFRQNPRQLAKKLELLRTYLDLETNVLSEPNKIQIQMVEGDEVFKEAIAYLKGLTPVDPLEWDPNLTQSAMEHVLDIGPKGLLSYQSSDGTEPEDRISKFGTFNESLGENIDFGPNDAIGVIISLTLDDGETQRPHRDNLFKADYHKIGIACGPHESEFQMCVMDFANDFYPFEEEDKTRSTNLLADLNQFVLKNGNEPSETNVAQGKNEKSKAKATSDASEAKAVKMNKNDLLNNSDFARNQLENDDYSQQSPFVKLSIEPDDYNKRNDKKPSNQSQLNEKPLKAQSDSKKDPVQTGSKSQSIGIKGNEFDEINQEVNKAFDQLKIISKKVEVTTKITYIYEDGSSREAVQSKNHTFNY